MDSHGAAPTGSGLFLTARAGNTSPITVLDVEVQVYEVRQMTGRGRIKCSYGGDAFYGATLYADLDNPGSPKQLDIDSDSEPDARFPGGRFVVEPAHAETLSIVLEGQPGQVYYYGLKLRTVENGVESIKDFGTRSEPKRVAFEQYQTDFEAFEAATDTKDWSFRDSMWAEVEFEPPA